MLTTDETASDQGRLAAKPGTSECVRKSTAVIMSSLEQTRMLCEHQHQRRHHISIQVGFAAGISDA